MTRKLNKLLSNKFTVTKQYFFVNELYIDCMKSLGTLSKFKKRNLLRLGSRNY